MFRQNFIALLALLALAPLSHAKEGDAAFAVSPDSAYGLLVAGIRDATKSIDVNIYMFTNKYIARALAAKAAQGVRVRVLVEGEPHGGSVFPAVKQTLDELNLALRQQAAAPGSKLLVMTGNGDKTKRRYVFNHAKYLVIDQNKVFVSSDNFTGSAFPDTTRNFYEGGTRGWQVLLENKALAKELGKIFEQDQAGVNDVLPYEKARLVVSDPNNGPLPDRRLRTAPVFAAARGNSAAASLCASPQSEKCVVGFIRSAKHELLVEHLSLPLYWKNPDAAKNRINPIVEELLAAAQRGVQVKVLVNDDRYFNEDDSQDEELKNRFLVAWLKKEATKRKLPLEAALFDRAPTQLSYVHNKGMVADGTRVFVSSVNGTQNSIENNREVAVSIETVDGARYFGEVFGFDWANRQK